MLRTRGWLRVATLSGVGAAAIFGFILFAYELALARVPQHRAALEGLVRAQTGLDVHFNEMGLRWGWYGPEAVFRHVELGEPRSAEVLLRAPELVVGFDAWRTLRSGQPEAGRIELIAPDIDLARSRVGRPGAGRPALAGAPRFDRIAMLKRWRGGRVDIEGGTLRLPDPAGSTNFITLQIRRASLRRSDDEWAVDGLVFLPDRVGRTARIVMRVSGDLGAPGALKGSLRVEAQRLLFPGCRDLVAGNTALARFVPRAGGGDVTVTVEFERGQLVKSTGTVRASAVVFDSAVATADAAASGAGRDASIPGGAMGANVLVLDKLYGSWRVARHGPDWRVRIDSLALGTDEQPASVTVDAAGDWEWVRGNVDRVPLQSVVAVARWLEPGFDLAAAELSGVARNVSFDWDSLRPEGERLHTTARFEDMALVPRSHGFILSGFAARVTGTESLLTADIQSHTARLELAQARQYPLADIHIAATVRIGATQGGWQISTDELLLEHERTRLSLSGSLEASAARPVAQILASGTLTGADVPFAERILGDNTAQAFGAAASCLTAGRIQKAEFELRGPLDELPFGARGAGFTGYLTLRDAIVSGGNVWPDAEGINARVEWRGARIQATLESGHAGPFQLVAARADWDAAGEHPARLTGQVGGKIEDAIAWVRDHPQLQGYAPGVQDIVASGNAEFDFSVTVPAYSAASARVSSSFSALRLTAVAGLPAMQDLSGTVVFDAGHLQHSSLTGKWLGEPVLLRVAERRENGARVFAVEAQGVLNAQQLASVANAPGSGQGTAEWSGDFTYLPGDGPQAPEASRLARWRLRADSNLLGITSSLPEPFAKRTLASIPVHIDAMGMQDAAQMHLSLGDRLRSTFAFQRSSKLGWVVDRGAVRFGTAVASLPVDPVVAVSGRLARLDLPAYAAAWQRLRTDAMPAVRAQVDAGEMTVGERSYSDVAVRAERGVTGTELRIDSARLHGVARWPALEKTRTVARTVAAEINFDRLELPDTALPGDVIAAVVALAPAASIEIENLLWRGRSLGRFTGNLAATDRTVGLEDARMVSATQAVSATIQCQIDGAACRASFRVASNDAGHTLADFGFSPELTASEGSFSGDLEWGAAQDRSWLANVRGTVRMHLAEGTLLGLASGTAREIGGTGSGDVAVADSSGGPAQGAFPFALLAVPALVSGLDAPGAPGPPLARSQRELRFSSLDADFDVGDGQALTSNLHFDGDAEILMRGRTGLVARDYDQQVWVLRGEERLPAAVRRFGATPRVAAVWLSLRDLINGSGAQGRSRAVLRLQGSWDDPMVVAAK